MCNQAGGDCGKTRQERNNSCAVCRDDCALLFFATAFFVMLELWESDLASCLFAQTMFFDHVYQTSIHQSQHLQFQLNRGCGESCEISEDVECTQGHDIHRHSQGCPNFTVSTAKCHKTAFDFLPVTHFITWCQWELLHVNLVKTENIIRKKTEWYKILPKVL